MATIITLPTQQSATSVMQAIVQKYGRSHLFSVRWNGDGFAVSMSARPPVDLLCDLERFARTVVVR